MKGFFPLSQQRAMVLAALLAQDYKLQGFSGAVPPLAQNAQNWAQEIMDCPVQELPKRIEREKEDLLKLTQTTHVESWYPQNGVDFQPLPGLEKLIMMYTSPQIDDLIVCFCKRRDFVLKLALLSTALIKRGASGERWALYLTTMGAGQLLRQLSLVPRLAPGIVWIACSLEKHLTQFEEMTVLWPKEVSAALYYVRSHLMNIVLEKTKKTSSFLRLQLEREITRIG